MEEICKSFKINTTVLSYKDAYQIYKKSKILVKEVRKNNPKILVLKSTRLGLIVKEMTQDQKRS